MKSEKSTQWFRWVFTLKTKVFRGILEKLGFDSSNKIKWLVKEFISYMILIHLLSLYDQKMIVNDNEFEVSMFK